MPFTDQLHLCVQIDVSFNKIDQAASLELIAAMKGKSMASIGMAVCQLGVEGAKAMAELVSVTGSLTELNLRANGLNESAKAALRAAARPALNLDLCVRDALWGVSRCPIAR